jgi:hypothetical protein
MNQQQMPVENAVYEIPGDGLIKVIAVGMKDGLMTFVALRDNELIEHRCSAWAICFTNAKLIESLPPTEREEKGAGMFMGQWWCRVFRRDDGTLELIEDQKLCHPQTLN